MDVRENVENSKIGVLELLLILFFVRILGEFI